MNKRSLTALFADGDSFFASCEQLLNPFLRGKAIAVAPVSAESSCCIAASYEAKRYGVKTGTVISDARRLCPGIIIVQAQPAQYTMIHKEVVVAVDSVLPVEAVLSIDEMWCKLPPKHCSKAEALDYGSQIKRTVRQRIGESVKVSVGIGPNKFIAKLASKLKKPDALHAITPEMLPEALHPFKLRDITGIGSSMEVRLHKVGIHSVEELCRARKTTLKAAWNSVLGERMWHMLQGDVIPDQPVDTKTIGHSHVLAPEYRHPEYTWPVVCKLLHKAAERLRDGGFMTRMVTLQLGYVGSVGWDQSMKCEETDSTIDLLYHMKRIWSLRPSPHIYLFQVGVVLSRLSLRANYTPPLITETPHNSAKHHRLDQAVDLLRARFGRKTVHMGVVHEALDAAPMRISFTHLPDIALEDG